MSPVIASPNIDTAAAPVSPIAVAFPSGAVVGFPDESTAQKYAPSVWQTLSAPEPQETLIAQAQAQSQESPSPARTVPILVHDPNAPIHYMMTDKSEKPVDVQYRPDQVHHVTLMGEHKTPWGGATDL